MPLNYEEKIVYSKPSISFYLCILLGFLFIYLFTKISPKTNETKLFLACTIIFLTFRLLLILGSYATIRNDAKHVFDAAIQMDNGNYSSLDKTEYLGIFPYQLGLATYERILVSFSTSPNVLYFSNLFFSIGIN